MKSSPRTRIVTRGVVCGLGMALATTVVASPVQAAAGPTAVPPPPSSLAITAQDLGTLPGDYSSAATDLNASGLVVGYSSSLSDATHAAMWRRGVAVRLPSGGSADAAAFGVNDRGFVVGRVGATAALWMHGKLIRLQPLPGGTGSLAEDITNRGLVVGYSVDVSGQSVPVTWSCGRVQALALPAGRKGGHADGVSNTGLVVGAAGPAVKWTRGVPSELGSLEGDVGGVATSVNDHGVVVGFSTGTTTWPVVWKGSAPAALQTPEGTTAGTAESVNRWGNVAGWLSVSGASRPALWWHGAYVDLGLAGRGGYASAINDFGRVVGWSSYGATLHATLWKLTTPGT